MVYVYIINLDKDTDRWRKMQVQLSMFANTPFIPQRISGVYGKSFDINRMNIVSLKTRACLDEPRSGHEAIGSLGEIGCYLSHYRVWKEFTNTQNEYCVICEDDIVFDKKILKIDSLYEKIKRNIGNSDNYPIAIFNSISIFYDKNDTEELPEVWRITGRFFGTWCYLINQAMAKVFINRAFPIEVQVDSYIAFLAKLDKNLYMYHKKEPDATLSDDASTISHRGCDNCYLPITKSMRLSIKIGIGVILLFTVSIVILKFRKMNFN